MRIEQAPGDFRVTFERTADRDRQITAGFATKPRLLGELDGNAAHAPHFACAGLDRQANAELFVHSPLQVLEFGQAGDAFQSLQQSFLFMLGEAQDA